IERITRHKITDRPRVFYGGADEPIYSVGPGSYLHDLIGDAGGQNVLSDSPTSWPRIDLESLVSRDPQVIVVGYHEFRHAGEIAEALAGRSGWKEMSAVKNRRVVVVGEEALRPGPRLIDVFEVFAAATHPEWFAD
ncbi:MAG: ABC transporter substrate-binding protein, partial [Candidatus Latescibacteria bacterium]|nr:ABC transporter substrate-binding protein [Candidatus Latescibacterota bacterium]